MKLQYVFGNQITGDPKILIERDEILNSYDRNRNLFYREAKTAISFYFQVHCWSFTPEAKQIKKIVDILRNNQQYPSVVISMDYDEYTGHYTGAEIHFNCLEEYDTSNDFILAPLRSKRRK